MWIIVVDANIESAVESLRRRHQRYFFADLRYWDRLIRVLVQGTYHHRQIVIFNEIAPFDIMDTQGDAPIPAVFQSFLETHLHIYPLKECEPYLIGLIKGATFPNAASEAVETCENCFLG